MERPNIKSKYLDYIDKKSPWQPSKLGFYKPNQYELENGGFETVKRCIALALVLELPVGEYAKSGSEGLANDQKYALIHNSDDEEVHYDAFLELYKSYGVNEEYVEQAKQAAMYFLDRPEYIFTAGYTELGIFFPSLAILRRYVNAYGKGVIADISRDENTHVRVNWDLIDDLNLYPSAKTYGQFNRNRKEIISWLVEPLGLQEQKTYRDLSNKLITRKQTSNDMSYTKAAIMPAFFELGYNPTKYSKK